MISGADSYSANGAAAFEEAAVSQGITVSRSLQVNEYPIYGSLSAAVNAIASSTSRVVFMMAQASTAGLILREAYAKGVFGAESGHVWFLTDGVTCCLSTMKVTNKPRFSFGFLATRAAFAHLYTTAAAQATPNDAPTLSTRSPSSESPVKTLTSDQKHRFFHPLAP